MPNLLFILFFAKYIIFLGFVNILVKCPRFVNLFIFSIGVKIILILLEEVEITLIWPSFK